MSRINANWLNGVAPCVRLGGLIAVGGDRAKSVAGDQVVERKLGCISARGTQI